MVGLARWCSPVAAGWSWAARRSTSRQRPRPRPVATARRVNPSLRVAWIRRAPVSRRLKGTALGGPP